MYWEAIYINIEIEVLMTIFDIEIVYEKMANKKSLKMENKELEEEVEKK